MAPRHALADLKDRIARELPAQKLLASIRGFNHAMILELEKAYPLLDRALLDVGTSPRGYALEAALEHGVALYEGIYLGGEQYWNGSVVEFADIVGRIGRLRQMNAEQLEFGDATFDCLLSISTFEHFLRPDIVLSEMYRVLKPGGVALVSFDGVWTCSYGYHLLQFEEINNLVPPWSHLFLSRAQMGEVLGRRQWPTDAPIDLPSALHLIYHDAYINRLSIRELRASFEASAFEIDWIVPLAEERIDERRAIAGYLSTLLPYTADELLTRGLSVLLRKNSTWRTEP
jgi:SAM-dependent methyltransferase